MVRYCVALVARLAAVVLVTVLVGSSIVHAETVVFSENFNDGDWTANPTWTASPADPSLTISGTRFTSAPYSLRVAANGSAGAIRSGSGLITATEPFTSTFNLYIESIPEEGIPWCLQDLSNNIVALIFLLPNGKVQFTEYSSAGWSKSDVPYSLTYGQWHSFRITYDGARQDLYIDGHTTPDATVNKVYSGVPAQILVGNFSMAHTGTYYVDDLTVTAEPPPPPANQGKIYVQFCSDTSTGGIGTSTHYNDFPADDAAYASPTGQAARIFADSYRNGHLDSLGHPIKLTWYMNCGSVYSCGRTTGPLLPFDLMMDYRGADVARWGDEMAYHYHTWFWDGTAWIQTEEFTPCQPDFETTVAHFVLDRSFYPSSFRAGWNWMSSLWERYLDDWFPYRFEGMSPSGTWTPYHPSPTDWQSTGSLRGWESPHDYTPDQTAAKIEAAFAAAYLGKDQVVTLWSHLEETDFPEKIDAAHAMLIAARVKYPGVEFQYVTGREAMLKWRNGTDTTPPVISVSTSDSGGIRTAIVSTNEDIYQKQPFVALKKLDGTYSRLDCAALGSNRWQVSYSLADSAKIAAAATDWFGNATVKQLPAPFVISNVNATATSTTIDLTWETSQPADSQLYWQILPSGTVNTYRDSGLATSHHVLLPGLQPGQVYKLDIVGTNDQGERVTTRSIHALTNSAEPATIDNSDPAPGFSLIGTWSTGNSAPGHYGADYRYVTASSAGTLYADWTWQAPTAGLYRISVWWSQGTNRCAAAKYSVIAGASEYPRIFNQQIDGGQWNEHGVYNLNAGQTVKVRLYNLSSAGNLVMADAARFEPAYTPVPSIAFGRLIQNGARVSLPSATVTAVFNGQYYLQEKNGVPGIKVIGGSAIEGDTVQVSGVLSTVDGERVITRDYSIGQP